MRFHTRKRQPYDYGSLHWQRIENVFENNVTKKISGSNMVGEMGNMNAFA
jgi:hypothetical protein